ncbi:MAG: triose-phosphate isomerase [Candidatus Omnitrophota bacterium]
MRKPIIAGNWKLNKTINQAKELIKGLKENLVSVEDVEIVVCPVYTALAEVAKIIKDTNIKLGAQDVYWQESGAYTGEVSTTLLRDVGCSYVIVGHSERRQFFHETNETVNNKARSVFAAGLVPIVCVGEKLAERESGKTFDIVRAHVEGALKDITEPDILKTVIAYEPVWAIGTGRTATPKQAEEVHAFIRDLLGRLYDQKTAESVRIQYGGSVTPENIKALMNERDIDGALVGGASLKAGSFVKIVKYMEAE